MSKNEISKFVASYAVMQLQNTYASNQRCLDSVQLLELAEMLRQGNALP